MTKSAEVTVPLTLGERKLITEPVPIGDFVMIEAVEFETDNLELVQQWLTGQMGGHESEYGHYHHNGKLEKWWRKRHKENAGKMETRAFRFSLPAKGPFKEGVKESSILLITTNMGGFCIVSPDVSIKETEIAYLARLRTDGQLKALPALRFGNPVERLQEGRLDRLATGMQIGDLRKEMGRENCGNLAFTTRSI